MKNQYRLFKRGKYFYSHCAKTGKQISLKTSDKKEAQRLLAAKNDSARNPQLNLALAKVFLTGHNQKMGNRTWSDVMSVMQSKGQESTRIRCQNEMSQSRYDIIRNQRLVETTSEDFFQLLDLGGNATLHYLRRLHNLALGLGWLPWQIIPPRLWPKPVISPKRAITAEEHLKILSAEKSIERKLYYELLWETGASQTDAANLEAKNIDWENLVLIYHRKKLAGKNLPPARLSIGSKLKAVLKKLPRSGPLFPSLKPLREKNRSTFFFKICQTLGIKGVTLHSYRYSFAQRAKELGVPERWAQAALGHSSRAVHEAYAKGANVTCPSLDEHLKVTPVSNGRINGG